MPSSTGSTSVLLRQFSAEFPFQVLHQLENLATSRVSQERRTKRGQAAGCLQIHRITDYCPTAIVLQVERDRHDETSDQPQRPAIELQPESVGWVQIAQPRG